MTSIRRIIILHAPRMIGFFSPSPVCSWPFWRWVPPLSRSIANRSIMQLPQGGQRFHFAHLARRNWEHRNRRLISGFFGNGGDAPQLSPLQAASDLYRDPAWRREGAVLCEAPAKVASFAGKAGLRGLTPCYPPLPWCLSVLGKVTLVSSLGTVLKAVA